MDNHTEISTEHPDDPFTGVSGQPLGRAAPQGPRVGHHVSDAEHKIAFGRMIWLVTFSLALAITVFIGPRILKEYAYAYALGKSRAEYEVAKVALMENPLGGISSMYELVAKKISPSVVHIDTTNSEFEKENLLFTNSARGQGAGVIYTANGYIVTNHHLILRAKQIRVTLSDRSTYKAVVVGTDEQTDIAVLKINAKGLIAGEWAKDEEIKVGTLAWAVGSPFGLDQSVTSGIVSGRHRRVSSPQSKSNTDYVFKDLIQTDTAINPGNSGGPLVNSSGKIMGINTSIIGGRYQGVCFAVPSEIVVDVTQELIKTGRVERGFLGVHPEVVSYHYAQEIGMPDVKGALIKEIGRRTPAARAGLQVGDVIRKWDETIIESELTLFSLVARANIDSTVKLVIFRDGREWTQSVTIASRDQQTQEPVTTRSKPKPPTIFENR